MADPVAILNQSRGKGAMLSQADALVIARRMGARGLLYGTLTSSGSGVQANATIYNVESGQTIAHISATTSKDSLAALTDSLTWKLLSQVWSRGRPPTPKVSSMPTHNPTDQR